MKHCGLLEITGRKSSSRHAYVPIKDGRGSQRSVCNSRQIYSLVPLGSAAKISSRFKWRIPHGLSGAAGLTISPWKYWMFMLLSSNEIHPTASRAFPIQWLLHSQFLPAAYCIDCICKRSLQLEAQMPSQCRLHHTISYAPWKSA